MLNCEICGFWFRCLDYSVELIKLYIVKIYKINKIFLKFNVWLYWL